MYGETSNVSISNGSTEECDNLAFYVTISDTDIGSLKTHHALFDKYLDHMLVECEQNRLVRTTNFELFDINKWINK